MALKKTPSDYPQLAFRISEEDKVQIAKLVEEVLENSNKHLMPNEKQFRKNDIYVDALHLGLQTLKKKGYRLSRL